MAGKVHLTDPQNNRAQLALEERGWTYADMAREIGTTRQAVYEIVHGKTKGATARYAFAKALGLEVSDIWPTQTENDHAA